MLRVAQRAFHNQEYASAYSAYRKVWRKLHGDAQAEALHNMAISAQEAGIKSGALTAARFLVRAQPSNGMGYVMLAAALEGRTDNAGAQERKWASAKARRLGEVIDEGNESDIFVAGL
jgi:predicted Zn-dependent protease